MYFLSRATISVSTATFTCTTRTEEISCMFLFFFFLRARAWACANTSWLHPKYILRKRFVRVTSSCKKKKIFSASMWSSCWSFNWPFHKITFHSLIRKTTVSDRKHSNDVTIVIKFREINQPTTEKKIKTIYSKWEAKCNCIFKYIDYNLKLWKWRRVRIAIQTPG